MELGQYLGPGGFVATVVAGLFVWLRDRRTSRDAVTEGPYGQLNAFADRQEKEIINLRTELDAQKKTAAETLTKKDRQISELELEIETIKAKHNEEVNSLRKELEECRREIRDLNQIFMGVQKQNFPGKQS